ncbi:MAG: DUF123 domain-containing protein, partial [Candidatus Methanosuratincola petrocarbonis]
MTVQGVYALVLEVSQAAKLQAGKGSFAIPQGFSVYCGSAMGPGGVEGRVARHFRLFSGGSSNHPHWHIDRLLAV